MRDIGAAASCSSLAFSRSSRIICSQSLFQTGTMLSFDNSATLRGIWGLWRIIMRNTVAGHEMVMGLLIEVGVLVLVVPDGPSKAWSPSSSTINPLVIALHGEAYKK